MKEVMIIDNESILSGFTSGKEGEWSRNEPTDPPTADYIFFSVRHGISLRKIIRPYQAGNDKVEIVSGEHGGSGVIRDNDLKKGDGLVTAQKGILLSIIAADCVPVYLIGGKAESAGLLHCGWRSASGEIIANAVEAMKKIGTKPSEIKMIIGPHICGGCYEVGAEVQMKYREVFDENELNVIFRRRNGRLYLDLAKALKFKAKNAGIAEENITETLECTLHGSGFWSHRRGDRGRQNLAFLMLKG